MTIAGMQAAPTLSSPTQQLSPAPAAAGLTPPAPALVPAATAAAVAATGAPETPTEFIQVEGMVTAEVLADDEEYSEVGCGLLCTSPSAMSFVLCCAMSVLHISGSAAVKHSEYGAAMCVSLSGASEARR